MSSEPAVADLKLLPLPIAAAIESIQPRAARNSFSLAREDRRYLLRALAAALDLVDVALADRDRARSVAVALEQENAQLQRQRNRLLNACERYAVPESAIRHACEPAFGV